MVSNCCRTMTFGKAWDQLINRGVFTLMGINVIQLWHARPTGAQYERIAPYLPVQRGNVRLSNLQVVNAIL